MNDPLIRVLEGFVEKGGVAGASLLLLRHGREIAWRRAGHARLADGTPFDRSTLCHMFSTSKPVVAAGLLTLVEAGRVAIDAPVSRYIPAYERQQVATLQPDGSVALTPARRPVTVHDLLTMTSGIPYPGGADDPDPVKAEVNRAYAAVHRRMQDDEDAGRPWGTLQYVTEIAACPLCFHPGADWLYGLSCDVLGGIIEAVTGMTLGQYLEEALFRPLGMRDTFFLAPADKVARVAAMYTDSPTGLVPWYDEGVGFRMIDNARFESGGAGLISTVDDYARFGQMLLNGGSLDGVRVLRPETVAGMATPHLNEEQRARYRTFNDGDEWGYSYGYMVRILQDPANSMYPAEGAGAFGWNGKAGTSLRIDPAHDLVIVFMTQRVPPDHKDYLPELSRAVYDFLAQGE